MRRQLKDGTVIYSSRIIGYFFILMSLWMLGAVVMTFLFLDPFAWLFMGFPGIDVPWKAVQAVQFRQEFYRVPMSMGVGVFRIKTESQPILYGGKTLQQIVQAMEEIAQRAETAIRIESDVSAGLIKTFLYGPPKWNDATHDDASHNG